MSVAVALVMCVVGGWLLRERRGIALAGALVAGSAALAGPLAWFGIASVSIVSTALAGAVGRFVSGGAAPSASGGGGAASPSSPESGPSGRRA